MGSPAGAVITRWRRCSHWPLRRVVPGMASFTAIAGWAADVTGEVLARLYERCGAKTAAKGGPPPGPPARA